MKILYYNWTNFEAGNNGGGVSVYQKNIIDTLIDQKDNEIYFLTSGDIYSLFSQKPFIRKSHKQYKSCKCYEIVNSPVVSPAYFTHNNLFPYLQEDKIIKKLLMEFIEKHGPFDVIHFNNLEGLPIKVLEIKKMLPDTKFIYSIHNYFAFCPLVQLFQNHNNLNCTDFDNGHECTKCAIMKLRGTILKNKINNFYNNKFINKLYYSLFKNLYRKKAKKLISYKKQLNTAETYKQFRETNIEYINKYIDTVISVSKRVHEIACRFGINSAKNKILYIGTKFANHQLPPHARYQTNEFTITYLGYPRIDKGFYFLLDALEHLPEKYAAKINLKFLCKGINIANETLNKLETKYHKIYRINGYTHNELADLLTDVDLGIVPVIWEDNLPQVAIEMVANGVPILASSLGGPSELSNAEEFKFEGGNVDDFIYKLINIIDNPQIIEKFWKQKNKLISNEEHINSLLDIYRKQ